MKNIIKYIPDSECFASEIRNSNGEVTHIITSLLRTTSTLHMEMIFKLYKIVGETIGFTGIQAYTIEEIKEKANDSRVAYTIEKQQARNINVHNMHYTNMA